MLHSEAKQCSQTALSPCDERRGAVGRTDSPGGGPLQAQRCALAVSATLRPRVLLLDEPTAALDAETVLLVEAFLKACGAALVWVSHDPAQPVRVGGRVVAFPPGSTPAAALPV